MSSAEAGARLPDARDDASARPSRLAHTVFWTLFVGLELALLWPLVASRWLPLVDLPQHLATTAALLEADGQTTPYGMRFSARLFPASNVTLFWLLAKLAGFMSLEVAGKVVVGLYAVALPAAVAWLAGVVRELEHRRAVRAGEATTAEGPLWHTLLVFPLVYNTYLEWGFLNFMLAMPVLVLFAGVAMRFAQGDSRPRTVLFLALLPVLVFLTHAQMYLFCFGASGLVALTGQRTMRRWLGMAAAMAPSIGLFVAWYRTAFSEEASSKRFADASSAFGANYGDPIARLLKVPDHLIEIYPGRLDELVLGMWVVLAVLWWGRSAFVRRQPPVMTAHAQAGLLSLAALACYFMLPNALKLQYFVAGRMLILCPLLAVAAMRPGAPVKARPVLVALTALVSLAAVGLVTRQYKAFSFQISPAITLMDMIPEDQLLVGVPFTSRSAHAAFRVYHHAQAYYPARRRGFAGFSFLDFPSSPVHYEGAGEYGLVPVEYQSRPWCALVEGYVGPATYFLVHGPDKGLMAMFGSALQRVERIKGWTLYRRVGEMQLGEQRKLEFRALFECSRFKAPGQGGSIQESPDAAD